MLWYIFKKNSKEVVLEILDEKILKHLLFLRLFNSNINTMQLVQEMLNNRKQQQSPG